MSLGESPNVVSRAIGVAGDGDGMCKLSGATDGLSEAPATEIKPSMFAAPSLVPSLRANFGWTLAGSVIYGACQWGMLSVLAKLGGTVIVGQFTLALAISAPVFTFTSLQLR